MQIRVQLTLNLKAVLSQIQVPRIDCKGRVAIFEIMLTNYTIRNLIRERKVYQVPSIIETSSQYGMQTIDQGLEIAVRNGIISVEEAMLRAQAPEQMEKNLESYAGRRWGNGEDAVKAAEAEWGVSEVRV